MNSKTISIKELIESGNPPEILFWIGCAGSYDERYKKVTKSFVKILNETGVAISFAPFIAAEINGSPS